MITVHLMLINMMSVNLSVLSTCYSFNSSSGGGGGSSSSITKGVLLL